MINVSVEYWRTEAAEDEVNFFISYFNDDM